jgi:multidrug efflux pump subunit AcrA (membrane-fusion protein)
LVPQAATALNNAIQHRRIPWSRWFDRWAKVDRCRVGSRLALVLAGIGLVALALVLIPANFYVEARGELLPQNRQEIFAPADGVIDRVAVKHGQAVSSHDLLVTLKQAELELEQARVDGALATARKKLAATQALQFESPRTRDSSPERLHQLAADEEELKELIRGLENQQKILAARQQALTVTSPLTGKILTWNVEPLLSARPVTRGQHLMTVADVAGPWELTLAVPDDRMGHVLFARQHRQQPMRVSFVVATDPGREYFAALDSIAQLTETDAEGRATVAAVVELPPGTIADPRPGAEVIAHIHCGRRSLGYVWFHDLIDAVRSWFFY